VNLVAFEATRNVQYQQQTADSAPTPSTGYIKRVKQYYADYNDVVRCALGTHHSGDLRHEALVGSDVLKVCSIAPRSSSSGDGSGDLKING
jgi:hypothetical protein